MVDRHAQSYANSVVALDRTAGKGVAFKYVYESTSGQSALSKIPMECRKNIWKGLSLSLTHFGIAGSGCPFSLIEGKGTDHLDLRHADAPLWILKNDLGLLFDHWNMPYPICTDFTKETLPQITVPPLK